MRATAYAENGPGGRITRSASAVFWERVVFTTNNENTQLYRSFKVDGVAGGGGRAQARFYWGYTPTPVSELEKLPNFGWVELGTGETVLEDAIVPVVPGFPVYIYAELVVSAGTGLAPNDHSFADFGNTGRFEWELPPGLTVTSASGAFMSEPVPEPSAIALVLVGAVAAGCGRHRSRRE